MDTSNAPRWTLLDGIKKSLFQIDCQGIFAQTGLGLGAGERSKSKMVSKPNFCSGTI